MLSIHQEVQRHQIYHQKNTPLVRAHFVVALNEAHTYMFKFKYFISEGCMIVMNILPYFNNDVLDIFCIYMVGGDWY
jgi:hypothetical protein